MLVFVLVVQDLLDCAACSGELLALPYEQVSHLCVLFAFVAGQGDQLLVACYFTFEEPVR